MKEKMKYCRTEKILWYFNSTKKSHHQTLKEIKEVVNDTEKANMNTHKLYQLLAKLRQKNKNTSISFGGQQTTQSFLNF